MLVTEIGIVMEVREEQPLNAHPPMLLILLEILIYDNSVQPSKALGSILDTLFPISHFINVLSPTAFVIADYVIVSL